MSTDGRVNITAPSSVNESDVDKGSLSKIFGSLSVSFIFDKHGAFYS